MKKFLKLMDVKKIVGVSGSKIYSMSREGQFPKPIKIGHRSMRWVRDEVNSWVTCKSTKEKYEDKPMEEVKKTKLCVEKPDAKPNEPTEAFWNDLRKTLDHVGVALKKHGLTEQWYDINLKVKAHDDNDEFCFREVYMAESQKMSEDEWRRRCILGLKRAQAELIGIMMPIDEELLPDEEPDWMPEASKLMQGISNLMHEEMLRDEEGK